MLRGGADAYALARALREQTGAEVRFDEGSRALYASDASNYRQVPIGVVLPRSVEDVETTVRLCREHGAPILPRGGGTSLCGQCCNVAVVIDFSKYLHRVLEIDPARRIARVQPGVVLDDLRRQAKSHGLTFAPDPATHTHNTLGGMIGNNSCGPHSVMGGETVHNVLALEVLTSDGLRLQLGPTDDDAYARLQREGGRRAEIHRRLRELGQRHAQAIRAHFPPIPRRVSGYNLPALLPEAGPDLARALVGSEGTCAVVLEATLRLLPDPAARALLVLGYPSVYEAADHVTQVMEAGPIALEGMDDRLIGDMKRVHLHPHDVELLPKGGGWLLVEFGDDTKAQADAKARALMARLEGEPDAPTMKLVDDPAVEQRLWKVRESGLGATAHVPGAPITWEGWEDSSVPPARLGQYLRALRALFERYGYGCDLYGHFGQGCVHTRIDFDLETAEGIAKFRRFLHEAAELVLSLGGSISGEHGDGQSKAELLPQMFGPALMAAFEEFKAIWDPLGLMNPGKIVKAFGADQNLRLGTAYAPEPVQAVLHFAQDRGDFNRALLRCVGVGECRKHDGPMCPSYQATREEMHSTRGRARLLFEMLNTGREDSVLRQGWDEPAVREALELCLSCKACRAECPVKVDMAAWKAEFMHHHYRHHPRPLELPAFAFVDRWARWAAVAPGLFNACARNPVLAGLARRVLRISPRRPLPQLAPRAFSADFKPATGEGRLPVLLWPDTFNNRFHPAALHAAAQVLERAGFQVRLPPDGLCCGRPLYEAGYLDQARAYLRRLLDALHEPLCAGWPIVVLEPACYSVFQAELTMMWPNDEQARRLQAQCVMLPEFLQRHAPDLALAPLQGSALLHGHCHHKAVGDLATELRLLRRLGLDVHQPESGCCGMAGSFGYGDKRYAVSMRCAERALLPAVREAAPQTLIVADGYSCREQIAQGSGRQALHVSQVLLQALAAARGVAGARDVPG